MEEIDPKKLAERMAEGRAPLLLDVREPWEHDVARIEDAVLIPMAEMPSRLNDFDPHEEVVVLCHHGIRSAQIASLLASAGVKHVSNLAGGIDAWSREVDSSVPRY